MKRLCFWLAITLLLSAIPARWATAQETINVVVWDEQQPTSVRPYENFLGNHIAEYLRTQPGLAVRSMNLDDAEQGLADTILDNCQVLVYWDHAKHHEIKPAKGKEIVRRIKAGQLSMMSLHSAHWSRPYIEAMYEVTRLRAQEQFQNSDEEVEIEIIKSPEFVGPQENSQTTPRYDVRKFPGGKTHVKVYLPNLAFFRWDEHGLPSEITTLLPEHPIAQGIPPQFTIEQTEMYDEPYHIPKPDTVIFEERWTSGDWFRSGAVWNLGQGKVFYFRPGHETFPVYKNKNVLKIIENGIRWLAAELP